MTIDDLVAQARQCLHRSFGGVVRVEVRQPDGAFWIDGMPDPPVVSLDAPTGLERGFCLWRASGETLSRVLTPENRRLEAAFVGGRLKISGDMAVMARLELTRE